MRFNPSRKELINVKGLGCGRETLIERVFGSRKADFSMVTFG
jgi:hypothetical protein